MSRSVATLKTKLKTRVETVRMKRLTPLLGGLAVGAIVALLPSSGRATIIGSVHDFTANTNYWLSGSSWVSRSNVCGVCHTIHHANPDRSAPLWTHASTLQTFQVYSSPTFQGGTPSITGSSKACLSCHDGSIAINQSYSTSGTNYTGGTAIYISSGAIIPDGTPANDLRNMHPIGFSYVTARATDTDLVDPSTAVPGVSGAGNSIALTMLKNGNVECASCHDIHRTKGAAYSTAKSTSGIMTIASGYQLCTTCHSK
jgi:nitrate/TMAO reductase-like tetraheme cytochrome c subunit